MRLLPSTGVALALLMAVGAGACSDAGQDAVPADEPAQTGSLPADPVAQPEEPAAEPAPEAPVE